MRLCDYGLVHQYGIFSRIARGKTGQTGIEEVTRQTPEISECLDFDLYDSVWGIDKKHPSETDNKIMIG